MISSAMKAAAGEDEEDELEESELSEVEEEEPIAKKIKSQNGCALSCPLPWLLRSADSVSFLPSRSTRSTRVHPHSAPPPYFLPPLTIRMTDGLP